MKPKTSAERQHEYRERRKKTGVIQITEWIPANRKAAYNKFCRLLRTGERIVVLSKEESGA